MHLALNRYILKKDNCEWGAPSFEQEQLTDFIAELSRYKMDVKNDKIPDKNKFKTGNKEKRDPKK